MRDGKSTPAPTNAVKTMPLLPVARLGVFGSLMCTKAAPAPKVVQLKG